MNPFTSNAERRFISLDIVGDDRIDPIDQDDLDDPRARELSWIEEQIQAARDAASDALETLEDVTDSIWDVAASPVGSAAGTALFGGLGSIPRATETTKDVAEAAIEGIDTANRLLLLVGFAGAGYAAWKLLR